MKKKQTLVATLVTVTFLSAVLGGTVAQAEDKIAETTGSVTFTKNDDQEGGNPTEPGGTDPLNPLEPGGHTNGALRIEYVPHFKFGTQKISLKDQTFNAQWNRGKETDTTTRIIPHAIQVTDERGSSGGFQVTLTASTFKDKNDENELKNTRLQFTSQTLLNSNEEVASNILAGLVFDSDSKAIINDNASTVLSTIATKTADGSKSFNVFSNNYVNEDFFGDQTKLPKDNEGVQLFSPGTDVKKADIEYKATLTWTLEAAL